MKLVIFPSPEDLVKTQVRSLAMCIDTSEPDSDDDEAAVFADSGDGGGVIDMFLAAVEMHPHRVACEEAMESKTYLQIYRHLGFASSKRFLVEDSRVERLTHQSRMTFQEFITFITYLIHT